MKNLFEFETEELFDLGYECSCGEKHVFSCPPIVTDGYANKIRELLSAGHIAFFTSDDVCECVIKNLRAELGESYRYTVISAPPFGCGNERLEEDVRLIIAVGGSEVTGRARLVADAGKIPLVVFPLSFDYAQAIGENVTVEKDGEIVTFKANTPQLICLSYQSMALASEDVLASAYGNVCASLVGVADGYFSSRLFQTHFCRESFAAIVKSVAHALSMSCDVRSSLGVKTLSDAALRIAIIKNGTGNVQGGEVQFAKTIERYLFLHTRDKRLWGENLFISSVIVGGVYEAFLKRKRDFLSVPPDRSRSVVGERKFLEIPDTLSLGRMRGYPTSEVIDRYKVNVYREEFLDVIKKVNLLLHEGLYVLRRIYSDAGFYMKNYLSEAEIKRLLCLAPDYATCNSLLSVIKDCGALEKYSA